LLWFNKYYLDQKNLEELTDLIKLPQFDGSVFSNKVLTILRDRCNSLKDFEFLSSYFFEDPREFDENLIKKHIKEETYQNLESLLNILVDLHEWNSNNINESIEKIISDLSIGFGKIGLPLRLALTSTVNSPSIDIVCEILGKETTIRRLEFFLSTIKD